MLTRSVCLPSHPWASQSPSPPCFHINRSDPSVLHPAYLLQSLCYSHTSLETARVCFSSTPRLLPVCSSSAPRLLLVCFSSAPRLIRPATTTSHAPSTLPMPAGPPARPTRHHIAMLSCTHQQRPALVSAPVFQDTLHIHHPPRLVPSANQHPA